MEFTRNLWENATNNNPTICVFFVDDLAIVKNTNQSGLVAFPKKTASLGRENDVKMTHTIHVWYIYLHLVDFLLINVGVYIYIYHTWML